MVSILLPLYIYPMAESWQPLLSMAASYSNVNFIVIVNPNSGPGTDSIPDENYISALRSLEVFPNVNMLGYVRCSYGDRDISEIQEEISIYGGWGEEISSLDDGRGGVWLQGIFIDEAPAEVEYVDLMAQITSSVRDIWWENMDTEATVIYNPGIVVDPSFYSDSVSIVAFEEAEAERPAFMSDGLARVDSQYRSKTGAIVHTYDGSDEDLAELVREVTESGLESLYVTDQVDGVYNEWPAFWEDLVWRISELS